MEPTPDAAAIASYIAANAGADEAAATAALMPIHNWTLFTIPFGEVVSIRSGLKTGAVFEFAAAVS